MAQFSPTNEKQLAEIVTWATAEVQPLEVVAGGSKRGLGRPLQVEHVLDVSGFAGIIDYEAAELVMTAHAATKLDDVEAALAQQNQMLAFEPPDWRFLLGSEDRAQTLGGVLACNLAGPRRLKAGAARDHLLGFQGVSGRGEPFKAGGKVVKNVTGYDLCKLLAGSHGTLAVLTEVSVKVLPRPEVARTVLLLGLDDAAAIQALADGLNSEHEVAAAAHLPQPVAARSAVSQVAGAGASVTAMRVEGPDVSVAYRCKVLRDAIDAGGRSDLLDVDDSARLWGEIRDARLLAEPHGRAVWRVSVAPASGPALTAAIGQGLNAEHFFDWGGGLVWIAVEASIADAGAALIRGAVAAQGGGHATLIRAPDGTRAAVGAFEPLPDSLAALSARVKKAFDPLRVLNPGRMYAGV